MRLNLSKPLIIFDLETTGLDIQKDRIIQISYIKVYPDGKDGTPGKEERADYFVNPGCPIPPLVTELTGISDADVADAKTFKELAPVLAADFKGCDFAGYNSNRFDVPLLSEELSRAQVPFDFSECRLIDAQNIFYKMERRNLAAAYKFFTGHKMEDDFQAHRSDQDTEATYRVLQGQLDYYSAERQDEPERILKNDMDFLAEFSSMNDNVDFAGKIVWKEFKTPDGKTIKREVFNFGKHRGDAVVDVIHNDPSFISWFLAADFTYDSKNVVNRIRLREYNNSLHK